MNTDIEYTAIIEKGDDGWYFAKCEQVPGAMTQGRTIEEAEENLKDAIRLVFDYERDKSLSAMDGRKFVTRNLSAV
jgi:predicted RNase H-like HicB family nuclease